MDNLEFIVLPIMLIGFVAAFVVQFRLHKYVSRQKILEIEDVTILWKNSIPPKEVLNEDGLKLYSIFKIGSVVFIAGCGLMVVTGFASGLIGLFNG